LHSGEDFRQAAFIFQHGTTPRISFWHTLAMVACQRRRHRGLDWAATLTATCSPSIGHRSTAQFRNESNEPGTQGPDRTLISDSLRLELGVPPLDAQQAQFKALQEQPAAGKSK
jgi:hypothetical protein